MKRFTMIIAVVAVLALAAPALADIASPSPQFSVGARMLTDFGWWNRSDELTTSGKDVGTIFLNMPGHSFLRTRYYNADKSVGGRIELGLKSLQPEASVSLRYAYGYWRVGNFRLLAGQTDNWFGSLAYHARQYVGLNEGAKLLLFGWGALWPHRVPQVQFTYSTATWGVQFALEEPRDRDTWGGATNVDIVYTFPRASLTLMFKAGGFMTSPGFSYVNHQYEAGAGSFDDSWTTWAINVPAKFTAGAFTIKFQGHYGINFQDEYPFYGARMQGATSGGVTGVPLYGPILVVGSGVKDATIYGGYLAGEYKIGKVMLTAGIGMEHVQNDAWNTANGFAKDNNTRTAFFVAAPYQVTKNFGVHPEWSYFKHGDSPATGNDQGNEWLLGIQFRFVF